MIRVQVGHDDSTGSSERWTGPSFIGFFTTPRETRIVAYSAVASFAAVAVAIALLASPASAEVHARTDRAASSVPVDASDASGLGVTAPLAADAVLEQRVRAGRHWRLGTPRGIVHVWVPAGYDAATAATVVFVHGYWVGVDEAWVSHRLAQQFALSGINAMFIAPDAPSAKREPVVWRSLAELVRTVADRIDLAMPARRLIAVGHSGAYRTLARWLSNRRLDTVVLLDAAYADYGLRRWVRASRKHRLVNIAYETSKYSNRLHRRLPSTRRVRGLPRDALPAARILYVRTGVGHLELVTGGVALPLALRAIGVPPVASAPLDLPLGLPARSGPQPTIGWLAGPPPALGAPALGAPELGAPALAP